MSGHITPTGQQINTSPTSSSNQSIKQLTNARRRRGTRGEENAPTPGGGKTKRRKRRKKGGFSTNDVIENNKNRKNDPCNRLSTPVNLLNDSSFVMPKLKKTIVLSEVLKEGKCTSLLNKFSKKANKAMVNSTKGGRRSRRKTKRRKTRRRTKRRKTRRKTKRKRKRKTRRKKNQKKTSSTRGAGGVEARKLETYRILMVLLMLLTFHQNIPADSYPNLHYCNPML